MYINVGNTDGFVKVHSGPYRVSGGGDSYRNPNKFMTLSSLLAIACFPEGFSVLDDRWGLEYDSVFLCLM